MFSANTKYKHTNVPIRFRDTARTHVVTGLEESIRFITVVAQVVSVLEKHTTKHLLSTQTVNKLNKSALPSIEHALQYFANALHDGLQGLDKILSPPVILKLAQELHKRLLELSQETLQVRNTGKVSSWVALPGVSEMTTPRQFRLEIHRPLGCILAHQHK